MRPSFLFETDIVLSPLSTLPPIGEVVPHSGRMLLLDRIVQFDAESLTSELTIHADSPFVRDSAIGAWVALEYMAQSIAAFAGCVARTRGEPPRVGFLIGSRHFTSNTPSIPVATTLRVHIIRELQDESGLGAFSATVRGDNIEIDAVLSVFQPHDVEQFMKMSKV